MVPFKPHTITVAPVTQGVGDDSVLNNPAAGDESPGVRGYIEQMTPHEQLEHYGAVFDDRFVFLCDVCDADTFLPNARVYRVVRGTEEQFTVMSKPEFQDADLPTDHAVIYLRRQQFKAVKP